MSTKPTRKTEWTLAHTMMFVGLLLEYAVANVAHITPLLGKWGGIATFGFGLALAAVNFWRAQQAKKAAGP
jgi:hypothetical protein